MERLIRIAWRTFWVGLGASAVLVGQTLLPPKMPAPPAGVQLASPIVDSPPAPIVKALKHVPRS